MSSYGKNIKIYLKNGSTNGLWMCELSNWIGKAYKISRTNYKDIINRDELKKNTAVYFLFGYNDLNNKPLVYIGETEDIVKRLGEHIKDESKYYWFESIFFINKDDHLNKAHVKYLESRFYKLATDVDRYEIMNLVYPTQSSLSEAEQDEMEEYISNVKLMVPVLGHKVFVPLLPIKEVEKPIDIQICCDYLYMKMSNNLIATGVISSEGFIVLKGSKVNNIGSNKSVLDDTVRLREQYESNNTLVNNTLLKDILFYSPSVAAKFVIGYGVSDARSWKNNEGKSINEINKL